jgi:Zn-dependent peptidase ImmA (M78 family)
MIIIPELRLNYIGQKVDELYNKLDIQGYPIIMLDILEQHYSDKYLIHFAEFSEKAEVVTNYYPAYDECVIIINEKCRQDNLQKRLNFSLAHEFGHIVLKHHLHAKADGLTLYYEREADEFAGQFLMPECEIAYMPRKLKLLSDFFFVSGKAASIRLQKLDERRQIKNIWAENRYDKNDLILNQLEQLYLEP